MERRRVVGSVEWWRESVADWGGVNFFAAPDLCGNAALSFRLWLTQPQFTLGIHRESKFFLKWLSHKLKGHVKCPYLSNNTLI